MDARELEKKLDHAIHSERISTNEVLVLINEALRTKAYLELGYPSMFEWLTKRFGYSNAAAQRRIHAAKLLKVVPSVAEKLNTGVVNLSTVTKVQQIIQIHEKSGHKVSKEKKAEILDQIGHKTERETEQLMISLFPDAASQINRDQVRVIDAETSRLSVNLPNEVVENLKRAKELLSHALPEGSDGDVLAYVLRFFLEKRDPLRKQEKTEKRTKSISNSEVKRIAKITSRSEVSQIAKTNSDKQVAAKSVTAAPEVTTTGKSTSAPEVKARRRDANVSSWKPIPAQVRRMVLKRCNGRCSFIDPVTKRVCGSRHQIEIDHILPRALGGDNSPENLRALCRKHNFSAAEKVFGEDLMRRFLNF